MHAGRPASSMRRAEARVPPCMIRCSTSGASGSSPSECHAGCLHKSQARPHGIPTRPPISPRLRGRHVEVPWIGRVLVFKANDGTRLAPGFQIPQEAIDELYKVATLAAHRRYPLEIHAYTNDAARPDPRRVRASKPDCRSPPAALVHRPHQYRNARNFCTDEETGIVLHRPNGAVLRSFSDRCFERAVDRGKSRLRSGLLLTLDFSSSEAPTRRGSGNTALGVRSNITSQVVRSAVRFKGRPGVARPRLLCRMDRRQALDAAR